MGKPGEESRTDFRERARMRLYVGATGCKIGNNTEQVLITANKCMAVNIVYQDYCKPEINTRDVH
jgi:hypothetical protein